MLISPDVCRRLAHAAMLPLLVTTTLGAQNSASTVFDATYVTCDT